jgi:benzodiazapine receptor
MDWGLFSIFLATCLVAGTTGAAFKPGPWYAALRKPVWTPPDWVFPVAWSTLYLLMSYSAMRVALAPGAGLALALWGLQIALNTLWTPVFFGLRRMREGFVVIVGLWLAVAATTAAFAQVDAVAGLAMLPYLVWVSVAAALNLAVWRLNPHEPAIA